jgi:hypothetical protein
MFRKLVLQMFVATIMTSGHPAPVYAGAVDPGELYVDAQADVQGALTNIHVLMAAAQARFKKMQWDFGAWGKIKSKQRASTVFRQLSSRLENFRRISESVTYTQDPLKEKYKALKKSPRVEAVRKKSLPDSTAEIIAEIIAVRGEYDADAARSALIRADGKTRQLSDRWGKGQLSDAQQRVLTGAESLLQALHNERTQFVAKLPTEASDRHGADRAARKRVTQQLSFLSEDTEALGVELKRLRLHYFLNNYQSSMEDPH